MSDKIFFTTEAIINFPKVRQIITPKETIDQFSCVLYFTKEHFENNIKTALKEAISMFKHAEAKAKLLTTIFKDDQYKYIKEQLGEAYMVQHQAKSRLDMLKCVDLYKNPLTIQSIGAGDRIYIKGFLTQTQNPDPPRQKYITMYLALIAKLEDKAYALFDEESQNREFYDALSNYKTDFESDPEKEIVIEEDSEKEILPKEVVIEKAPEKEEALPWE